LDHLQRYKITPSFRMALMGSSWARSHLVVEKLEELRQHPRRVQASGVEPMIGIRTRLLSKGMGKWAESGGENAKSD